MTEPRDLHFSDDTSRLIQPDVFLPAQFIATRRRPTAPEERLMLAILEDAINCFQKYRETPHPQGQRLHREAKRWLMDSRMEWPFSFERICEVLGLDVGYVRRGLGVPRRSWVFPVRGRTCRPLLRRG